MSINNMLALIKFIEENGLKRNPNGAGEFSAMLEINGGGIGGVDILTGYFRLDSGSSEQLSFPDSSFFEVGKHPLSYKTDYGEWKCVDGVLSIEGHYKNYDYIATIQVDV